MKKSIHAFLFLLTTVATTRAQVCFQGHTEYTAGSNPQYIICADLNNDNDSDLVVANSMDNNIAVYLGDGSGTYTNSPPTYTGAGMFGPQGLAAGDFNEDGFLDLAVAGGGVAIFLNDGLGGFTFSNTYSTPSGPWSVAVGDINGDGNLDAVTANYSSNNISILLGDGLGNLGTATNTSCPSGTCFVTLAYLNADANLDIVTGNYLSSNISVFLSTGPGTFAARVNYAHGNPPGGIVAVDFDEDGDKDLAVSGVNLAQVRFFRNNGSGGFAAGVDYPTSCNSDWSITTADFNLDGHADVAVNTSTPNNSVDVLLGNGAGGFSNYYSFPTGIGARGICAGNLDSDGRPDLATADFSNSSMSVLLGNPIAPNIQAAASDTVLCAGDMLTLFGINTTGDAATYTWQPQIQPGIPADSVAFLTMGGMQTTFTVTGTTTGGCSGRDTLTIFVNMRPNIYGGAPSPVCAGQSVTFSQGSPDTGVTFSWSDGVQVGVPYFPTSSHTYTLTGTAPNGCTNYTTSTVNITPGPIAVIASGSPVFQNDPYTLSSTGSSGGNAYQWTGPTSFTPAGTTPGSPTTNVTAPGTYTLQLINTTTGCNDTATAAISFVPAPLVVAHADHSIICSNTQVVFTGSGANSYTWSGGVTNGVPHAVPFSMTFMVTGTDGNGCHATDTVHITINTPPAPDICRITVDSLSHNNVIYWDKTLYPMAENFYIYRDTANNAYGLIGVVPYDSLSEFTDTLRSLYAANGDPNVSSWRYKIAIMDTCGAIGPKGLYHQSIFMQNNTGNFSWSEYKIEGQGTPVSGLNNYVFKRDNLSNGNYAIIQVLSASSTSYTDPNYGTYIGTGTWRTETAWSSGCVSSMRIDGSGHVIFGAINTSRSNIKSPSSIGMKEVKGELNVSIYPVPANTSLTVELSNASDETSIDMTNALGQVVYSVKTKQLKNTIDCSEMQSGVYFITIRSEKCQSIRKVIVQ